MLDCVYFALIFSILIEYDCALKPEAETGNANSRIL